ncbi:unannotated protein [freshwater metagenome]|uniref:Unannotated protein n=1 Tax=freshwater metagenome TaxID=449393 RepID=A0A6J7HAE7_9ZZZZ
MPPATGTTAPPAPTTRRTGRPSAPAASPNGEAGREPADAVRGAGSDTGATVAT